MGFWSWLFGSKQSGGTRIKDLQVLDVVDGDTIHVELNGEKESLRFCCVDTEESQGNSNKPITKAGKMASEMAKAYFKEGGGWGKVDLEFETDDPVDVCLHKHRGTYGRLICTIHKGGENFNLKLIQEGWSPYFVKYGRARLYHEAFAKAHEEARKARRVIWDPETNKGGPSRDYDALLPWWETRGDRVQVFRDKGRKLGALDLREDYEQVLAQRDKDKPILVFADLQGGISAWPGDGAVLNVGTKTRPFSLWIPEAKSDARKELIETIEKRYAKRGLGYCYIHGPVTSFKDKAQIVLTDAAQLRDEPS